MIGLGATAGIGAAANVLTSGINNIANAVEAQKTRNFNAEQAEINRNFQRDMAQNNIKYAVQQAKELGISPSLVLGDQTRQLGGSQASGTAARFDASGVSSGINSVINAVLENQKLQTLAEMQENKYEAMKDLRNNSMRASTNQRNYSKEQIQKLYDNLDNIKI